MAHTSTVKLKRLAPVPRVASRVMRARAARWLEFYGCTDDRLFSGTRGAQFLRLAFVFLSRLRTTASLCRIVIVAH